MSWKGSSKDYEARLQERTAVRTMFAETRLEGYINLALRVRQTRRSLKDCLEADDNALNEAVVTYISANERLEEALYSNSLTLHEDGLYIDLHTYKNVSETLAKTFRNVARLRDDRDGQGAETLWMTSQETADDLLAEGDEIVENFIGLSAAPYSTATIPPDRCDSGLAPRMAHVS